MSRHLLTSFKVVSAFPSAGIIQVETISPLSSPLTALDDIIKANPKKRGSGRGRGISRRTSGGGARAAALGKGAANAAQNAAAIAAAKRAKAPLVIPGRAPGGKELGSKIIISNLPFDVTESQVKVRATKENYFSRRNKGRNRLSILTLTHILGTAG